MVLFGEKYFNFGKMVVIGQNCCIRARIVLIGQKWFSSSKTCSFRAKVVVLGQSGCIMAKWF